MIDKKIYRHSNVELFDVIKNGTDNTEIKKAESEFESRNLTNEQKVEIESHYVKYKKFQNERKDKSLTIEEWFSFFFLPFFTPKPQWREDHFSKSESQRFEKYGFEKKARQSETVRALGILFWLIIIVVGTLIFNHWNQ